MVTKVEIGNATLYHGDCLEILPTLPKVDAVITDPPYGVGFKYASHDDSAIGYGTWIWSCIESAERSLGGQGVMCVFQSATHCRRWPEWFPRDWKPIAITKAFVQMYAGFVTAATDYALYWQVGEPVKTKPDWQPEPARDWFYSKETAIPRNGPERGHPCPRPLDMMHYLVGILTPPDALIIDPFAGSGSTGVACMNLGRKFIGIEIEKKYFDIACERIDQAQRQGRMFA